MIVIYVFIVLLFLIPYLLPQAMPKRAMTGYSVVCFFIASYIAYDIYKIPAHQRWGGLGGALSQGIIYLVGLGVLLGILVRIIGYIFSYKKLHRKYYQYLLIITPFLFCAYNYVPDLYRDWKRRVPNEQCSYDTANLSIGKKLLDVPTLSIIAAALDDGNRPIKKMAMLHFLSNESLRIYCTKTNNGKSRLPVNAISVHFNHVGRERHHNERFKALCKRSGYFFCEKEDYFGTVPYVEDLALYFVGHYNADKMYGGAGETLIKELEAGANGDNNSKYSFIKINNLHDYNGKVVLFRCRDSSADLFCQTNIAFSTDVRLIAGYVVSHENTGKDLLKLYKDSLEFLNSMEVKEADNGRAH